MYSRVATVDWVSFHLTYGCCIMIGFFGRENCKANVNAVNNSAFASAELVSMWNFADDWAISVRCTCSVIR